MNLLSGLISNAVLVTAGYAWGASGSWLWFVRIEGCFLVACLALIGLAALARDV